MASILPPIRLLTLAVWAWGIVCAGHCLAEEPAPENSPETSLEFVVTMMCDATNKSWTLANRHTWKSIQVTVRWHPDGGKEASDEFVLAPGTERPVGCAPVLQIVSAKFMDF